MQKLIIITGSPCVGKTAVAEKLFESLENCAYFDGDWAWCVNPFSVSDPRLRNGDKTMSFALSTYLSSDFDYVVFSSVVVLGNPIRNNILRDITAKGYEVIGFTLTCSEKTLLERHKMRGDETECSFEWLRAEHYQGDYVMNTDDKTIEQIVGEMTYIINNTHIELHTEDLVLRTVISTDIEEVARMWEFEKGAISLEEARKAIEYMQSNHSQNKRQDIYHLCFAVYEKGKNKIIGWCGLDGKSGDKLHIFYLIEAEYRNKGYATQCANKLLSYAFDEASVAFVNGGCDKENISSIKVMTKVGMKRTGFEENGDPLFYISKAQHCSM